MQFLTLEEGKSYLRVDSDFDDSVITTLLTSAEILCCEVARLTEEEWAAVCAESWDKENGTIATMELTRNRALMRVAVLYALGYLYEHREEADYHDLVLTLRSILFPLRKAVV